MTQRTTASGRRSAGRSATAAAAQKIQESAAAPAAKKSAESCAEAAAASAVADKPALAAAPMQADAKDVSATDSGKPHRDETPCVTAQAESAAAPASVPTEHAMPPVKKTASRKKAAPAAKKPAAPCAEAAAASAVAGKPALAAAPVERPENKESHAALAEYLEHGSRVAALAMTLFDATAFLHALAPVWRVRLMLAAQWHDLGMAEGRKGHHKASMRIILADQKLQVSDEDRPYVALLARYHRKAWPSPHHRHFAELSAADQRDLSLCAALLRVADGLDWTHSGSVKTLEVQCKKHRVTLLCSGSDRCPADMARALRKGDLFMKLFDRNLTCQIC